MYSTDPQSPVVVVGFGAEEGAAFNGTISGLTCVRTRTTSVLYPLPPDHYCRLR